MISALHLIWIIPLSGTAGFFIAAVLAAANHPHDRPTKGG